MLCFNFTDEPTTFETSIDCGNGETFSIVTRVPTCEERICDAGLLNEVYATEGDARQKAWRTRSGGRLGFVIGWKGVNASDGKPYPFSNAAFRKLLQHRPGIIDQVHLAIAKAFEGDEVAEKKSPENADSVQVEPRTLSPNTGSEGG